MQHISSEINNTAYEKKCKNLCANHNQLQNLIFFNWMYIMTTYLNENDVVQQKKKSLKKSL